eukprot:CFRG0975T1
MSWLGDMLQQATNVLENLDKGAADTLAIAKDEQPPLRAKSQCPVGRPKLSGSGDNGKIKPLPRDRTRRPFLESRVRRMSELHTEPHRTTSVSGSISIRKGGDEGVSVSNSEGNGISDFGEEDDWFQPTQKPTNTTAASAKSQRNISTGPRSNVRQKSQQQKLATAHIHANRSVQSPTADVNEDKDNKDSTSSAPFSALSSMFAIGNEALESLGRVEGRNNVYSPRHDGRVKDVPKQVPPVPVNVDIDANVTGKAEKASVDGTEIDISFTQDISNNSVSDVEPDQPDSYANTVFTSSGTIDREKYQDSWGADCDVKVSAHENDGESANAGVGEGAGEQAMEMDAGANEDFVEAAHMHAYTASCDNNGKLAVSEAPGITTEHKSTSGGADVDVNVANDGEYTQNSVNDSLILEARESVGVGVTERVIETRDLERNVDVSGGLEGESQPNTSGESDSLVYVNFDSGDAGECDRKEQSGSDTGMNEYGNMMLARVNTPTFGYSNNNSQPGSPPDSPHIPSRTYMHEAAGLPLPIHGTNAQCGVVGDVNVDEDVSELDEGAEGMDGSESESEAENKKHAWDEGSWEELGVRGGRTPAETESGSDGVGRDWVQEVKVEDVCEVKSDHMDENMSDDDIVIPRSMKNEPASTCRHEGTVLNSAENVYANTYQNDTVDLEVRLCSDDSEHMRDDERKEMTANYNAEEHSFEHNEEVHSHPENYMNALSSDSNTTACDYIAQRCNEDSVDFADVNVGIADADAVSEVSAKHNNNQDGGDNLQYIHNEEFAVLRDEHELLVTAQNDLLEEHDELQKYASKLEHEIEDFQQQNDEMSKRWATYETAHSKVKADLAASTKLQNTFAASAAELNDKLSTAEAQLTTRTTQVQALQIELKSLNDEVTSLHNEIKLLRIKLSSVSSEKDSVREEMTVEVDKLKASLQAEIEKAIAARNETMVLQLKLEGDAHENGTQIDALHYSIEKLQVSIRDATRTANIVQSERDGVLKEFEEYKKRAGKILHAKDLIIEQIQSGTTGGECSNGSGFVSTVDTQRDLEALRSELLQSQIQVKELRFELQNVEEQQERYMEMRTDETDELENEIHRMREDLDEMEARHAQTIDEYKRSLAEANTAKSSLMQKIQEQREEIEHAHTNLPSNDRDSTARVGQESRMKHLTDQLIQQQQVVESLTTNNKSLSLELESEKSKYARDITKLQCEDEEVAHQHSKDLEIGQGSTTANSTIQHLDPRVFRGIRSNQGVRSATGEIDAFSIKLGLMMLRYPAARIGFLLYAILLQLWVGFIMFFYGVEEHASGH